MSQSDLTIVVPGYSLAAGGRVARYNPRRDGRHPTQFFAEGTARPRWPVARPGGSRVSALPPRRYHIRRGDVSVYFWVVFRHVPPDMSTLSTSRRRHCALLPFAFSRFLEVLRYRAL